MEALDNARLPELGYGKIARLLAALGLELRLAEAGQRRPTLEDLLKERTIGVLIDGAEAASEGPASAGGSSSSCPEPGIGSGPADA